MHKLWGILCIAIFAWGCKTTQTSVGTQTTEDDQQITFKFIQVNDVYEIAPLSGGKYGGMARVAHVRDSVRKVNPNTFLFMAGDFLNPSLLGTVKVDGERLNGKQMIEVMNSMRFDLVTFGNHEFDIGEEALQKRLDESQFKWTVANVWHRTEQGLVPFSQNSGFAPQPIPTEYMMNIYDQDGTQLKIGFLSVCIDSNPQDFVSYGDPMNGAVKAFNTLEEKGADVIFGLTHLEIEQDTELAQKLPQIPLIMGGHEHNNMLVPVGDSRVAKADANAKSLYIHTITYNKATKKVTMDSHLMPIDETVASAPGVKAVVDKWNVVLESKIKEVVEFPYDIIMMANPPLDGTDSASRGVQTNLGGIITQAMALSFNEPAQAALVNGGSIRIDDMLAGEITAMDIFRVLPFGGSVLKVDMKGDLLLEVLKFGKAKGGTGAYLQRFNFEQNQEGKWMLGNDLINPDQSYTIAVSDFLMKGYDIPFLTPDHPGVLKVYEPTPDEAAADVRKAVITFIKTIKH